MEHYFLSKAITNLKPNAAWVVRGDSLEWNDTEDTPPTEQELQIEIDRLKVEHPWNQLRLERDHLLSKTDWWATSDRTMTAEQIAYRQALRDLPDNTTDPENPVWPTKP